MDTRGLDDGGLDYDGGIWTCGGFEHFMVLKLEIVVAHGHVEGVWEMTAANEHVDGGRKWTCRMVAKMMVAHSHVERS
mgnify:CR=1 FL=1